MIMEREGGRRRERGKGGEGRERDIKLGQRKRQEICIYNTNLSVESMATVEPTGIKVDHVLVTDNTRPIFIIVSGGHHRRVSNSYLLARPARSS